MSSTAFPKSPAAAASATTGSNNPPSASSECRMLLNVARYYDVISRLVDVLDSCTVVPEAVTVVHQPDLQQVLVCYGGGEGDDADEIIEECPPEEILALEQGVEDDGDDEMIVFEETEEEEAGEEVGFEEVEADLQDLVEEEPIETDEEVIEFEVDQFEEESAVSEYFVEYLQDETRSELAEGSEKGEEKGKDEERFKCQFVACDKRFMEYQELQSHLKKEHTGDATCSQLQCKYGDCSATFDENGKLYAHLKTHGSVFELKDESKKHKKAYRPSTVKSSSKPVVARRKCEFCKESFDTKINVYNLHCLEAHGRPLYNCFVCAKTFYLLAHLNEHIKSGHDAATAKSFIMQSLWRTFQEDNATINECRMCFRLFSSPRAETQHQEFHLKELSLTCTTCGGKHYTSQCNEPRPKFGTVYEKVQCPQCERWMSKKNIKEHIATHANERNFPCTVCKKTFKVQRTAHRHIQNHINAQNKQRKCYDCEQVFSDEDELPTHYQTSHPGKHPYNCPICGQGFYQKAQLADHVHTHSDEDRISVKNPVEHYQVGNARVYECTLCRRGFSAKRTVVAHFIVHTDRPFVCELCGASFRAKAVLEEHVLDVHKVKMET
uniref:Zinc finger protein 26 n=1 Tax=Culex pipiens TaxID=7175 RepID=A0A8D8FGN2_CULPI